MIEVEVFQGLSRRESRRADADGCTGGFPGGDFTGQYRGQVFLMGPAAVAGLLGLSDS